MYSSSKYLQIESFCLYSRGRYVAINGYLPTVPYSYDVYKFDKRVDPVGKYRTYRYPVPIYGLSYIFFCINLRIYYLPYVIMG